MVKIIHDKILDFNGVESIPCVLVANKTDLDVQREVSTAEGQALAQELQALFIETSAKRNENINKLFDILLQDINRRNEPPEPKGGCVLM
ncbi:GTP-binding protein [Apophysomyces ossiformis]|uniref:GTP-binding protein n=1 Tax=Apophysomyces ossiformis TaxID=679940 RepID=A0A8H7BJJ1_9FUNG|nr:GTP-binding protein [Apophysomyces ossiformis]